MSKICSIFASVFIMFFYFSLLSQTAFVVKREPFFCAKKHIFHKKCTKNEKKCTKICVYKKFAVSLHRQTIKKHTNMKTTRLNFEDLRKVINRNFRIKVNGIVNGVKRNVLVGVSGLLEILGGNIERLQKFVDRAFASMSDKCTCKIYGGASITFYVK